MNEKFILKITDEFEINYSYEFFDLKSLRTEMNRWLKTIGETPLYKMEIIFE